MVLLVPYSQALARATTQVTAAPLLRLRGFVRFSGLLTDCQTTRSLSIHHSPPPCTSYFPGFIIRALKDEKTIMAVTIDREVLKCPEPLQCRCRFPSDYSDRHVLPALSASLKNQISRVQRDRLRNCQCNVTQPWVQVRLFLMDNRLYNDDESA